MTMRHQRIDVVLGDEMPAFVVLTSYSKGASCLTWNDGLVNEWHEDYPSLSLALMRLACLTKCAENEFHSAFTGDANAFSERAQAFLDGEVS